MDRADSAGLGLSVAGHAALLAALSLGLFAAQNRMPVKEQPLDVQFVDAVALEAAAPTKSSEAPTPSVAPEVGPPEEAPPPAPAAPAPPEPTPAPPQPKPAPPAPAPTPTPKPVPAKPQPAPAKPSPAKPSPAKPSPAKPTAAPAKPAPPRERLGNDFLKGVKTESPGKQARGTRLGNDFLKGIGGARDGKARTPPAAISGAAAASLASAVREQMARYWVPPVRSIGGLRTSLRVRLNRDGSIAGRPEVIGQTGLTDENRAYARQHADAAIRTVFKAAPLKLPADLYDYWKLLEPLNFDATLDR